jgi:hypothetical protein
MSQHGRRALFYVLTLIFLILGTSVVFFAQGWRMDLPSFHISKVGGIYVHSYPENADIFLNGRSMQNQSGFLSRGTLISNLFPKTYHLALTAAGYDDWNENVAVDPSLVADHQYAVLIPASAAYAATDTVASFDAGTNGILSESSSGKIMVNGKTIGSGKMIAVSPDMRSLIFQTSNGAIVFADLAEATTTNVSELFAEKGFSPVPEVQFSFDPSDDGAVFAVNAQKVEWFEMRENSGVTVSAASKGTVITGNLAVSPSTAAWTHLLGKNDTASSTLVFYDLSLKTIATTTVALGSPVKELSWVTGNLLGILSQDGSFFLYDTNQRTLQKIADDVRSASATQDGSRIAALESRSLEIFTLGDPSGYYRFNLPNVADAQGTAWYRDDDHLFIFYADHVAFLDLEDAGLTNYATVARGTSPQYNPDANALYLIDPQSRLIQFNFPR